MRTSVSNIAWGGALTAPEVDLIVAAGVDGVEIAPTALWPSAPDVDLADVRREAARWSERGLSVSAVQSLLYGHPELAVFDPSTHDALLAHLTSMVAVAGALGAGVAVFGSPKNRVRGALTDEAADEQAAELFSRLIPVLERDGVVLSLEPNAPAYGADYLLRYADCIRLARLIDSPWIAPQVDTGCLAMVEDDVPAAVRTSTPVHVHMSAPQLAPPTRAFDHDAVADALRSVGYDGWVTLEMRQSPDISTFDDAVRLLVATYGDAR